MSYQLLVISGADEGRRFDVGEGEILIGRAPEAPISLKDESISYEHAIVRIEDGRLYLQNLSAMGTTVRGRKVSDRTRVSPNDEIELSAKCRVLVELTESGGGPNKLVLGVVAVVLVLVLIGGAAIMMRQNKGGPPPISMSHWTTAYIALGERLDSWTDQGRIPADVALMFRDSWRHEQAMGFSVAAGKWERLNSALLSMPSPLEEQDDRTFAELASANGQALSVLMGLSVTANTSDLQWTTDRAYADALVWFVRKRAQISRNRAGDDG